MNRLSKKFMPLVMLGALALTGCQGTDNGGSSASVEGMKIGVLVADVSGEEAKAFRSYYTDYIAEQYNVTIEYTQQLSDAAGEKSAIEDFAGRGFDAVVSMSSNDRDTQLATAIKNQIYYVVGSGMLDDSTYEKYKTSAYFIGQIGPDMEAEYNAGKAMGEYYKNKNVRKVGMYGAFIPNPMHVYRAAGVLSGLGLSYDGKTSMNDVVGAIYAGNGIDSSKISGDIGVEYLAGFDPNTVYETLGTILNSDINAFLSVGMATTFFAQNLNQANIQYGDIDAFTRTNQTNMKEGSLNYLAGKYASSIGPVFALLANAKIGHTLRDASGNAPSISQGYEVATSADEFDKLAAAEQGDTRIFSKAVLDTMIGEDVTYDSFVAAVQKDRI